MAPTWKSAHDDGGDPVDAAFLVLAAHAEVLLDLLADFGDGWDDSGQLGCGGYWASSMGVRCWSHVLLQCGARLNLLTIQRYQGLGEVWCKTFVMPPKGVS